MKRDYSDMKRDCEVATISGLSKDIGLFAKDFFGTRAL